MALMLSAAKSNNIFITELILSDLRELYSINTNYPGVAFPSLRNLKLHLEGLPYPPPSERQRAPWISTCLGSLQELSVEYLVPDLDWRLYIDVFEILKGLTLKKLTTLELVDLNMSYQALEVSYTQ